MKILIAEDDRVSRRLLETRLQKWGYEVVLASNGVEALAELQRDDAPCLAILDWMMPGMDGVQVCRELRSQGDEPYTYLLLLTAKDRKEDLIEGLNAGADDYLTKPFNAQELKVRLRAGRRIVELQAELIKAREELRHKAMHDPLTSLWNHAAILEILQRELARSEREATSLGITMADLDHFKSVNDSYGHLIGDEVLREAAQRMQGTIRTYDSLGRYGGEEFLFVLPRCDTQCSGRLAERLRSAVSERAMALQDGTIRVTISLGVVATESLEDLSPETLLRAADTALYRAKSEGRNAVRIATREDFALG